MRAAASEGFLFVAAGAYFPSTLVKEWFCGALVARHLALGAPSRGVIMIRPRQILLAAFLALALVALMASGGPALAKQGDGGSFFDQFNDGIIGEAWDSLATDGSSIYEGNGVLNMEIAQGQIADGSNQLVDAATKEHLLKGDVDVQVNFEVSPDFHTQYATAAILSLERRRGLKEEDYVAIGIYKYGYISQDGHEDLSGGTYTNYVWTASDDLEGKLRITRKGDLITTYYWNHGWERHAQWESLLIHPSDDLAIRFWTWNGQPEYPAFWVKWDNLIANWHPHSGK